MKVKITTDRLPNKYPKGEVYEVEEASGVLLALLSQGEAEIVGEKKVEKKEVKKEAVKKK